MGGSTKVVPTTQNTQQTVEIPQYIKDAGMAATAKAQDYASKPYEAFGGEQVAGLTANQKSGIDLAGASKNAGQDAIGFSKGALGSAGQVASTYNGAGMGDADYAGTLAHLAGATANDNTGTGLSDLADARGFNSKSASPVSSDDILHYFNPYVQTALDPVIANLTRSSGATDAGIRARAGMTGAFGGSRATLQQGQNNADLLRQIATTTGQGYSDAYDRSLAAAQSDRARQAAAAGTSVNIGAGANSQANDVISRLTQASGASTAAGLAKSNLADASQNRFLSLVNPSNQTGAAESQLSTDAINRLLATGGLEQSQQQNVDNAAYQQYQNQQDYALKQLNALIAAAGGVPYGTSTDSKTQGTQVVQTPSMFGQLLGVAGAAAAAASNREWKEEFKPVEDEDILTRFRELPVEKYRYKPEFRDAIGDDGRERVGPMAQDWAKQFGGNGKIIPMPEIMGSLVSAVRALERRTAPTRGALAA